MWKNKYTIIGLFVAVVFYLTVRMLSIDFFEFIVSAMWSFDAIEIDEFIFPLIIFFTFFHIGKVKDHRLHEVEVEKIKVYKAMLKANHHILNNFLNKVEFYKLKAEGANGSFRDVSNLFDQITESTLEQIYALGNLESVDESTIAECYCPKHGKTNLKPQVDNDVESEQLLVRNLNLRLKKY